MSEPEYLLGDGRTARLRLTPFAPSACAFFDALSKELRADAAAFPDVAAFAFWCRRASIARMKKAFGSGERRLGRGTVFHIAPSNVPVNFAYSFAFGLLAGNANIVRVPTRPFEQVERIIRGIGSVLAREEFLSLRGGTAFVRYERDDEITARFSAGCDARIIWGGDETIRRVRSAAIAPRAVEIAFADRYSFALLDAEKIEALDDNALRRLADAFANDALTMGQRACSSPHLVVWLGESSQGRERFWRALARSARRFQPEGARVVDKFTKLCANAIDFETPGPVERFEGNLLDVVRLDRLPERLDALRGDAGLFYEYRADSLDALAERVTDKFQTAVVFGVSREKIADWIVEKGLAGIDRVVPVGSALDIGLVWDGYDVIRTLSRRIDSKPEGEKEK